MNRIHLLCQIQWVCTEPISTYVRFAHAASNPIEFAGWVTGSAEQAKMKIFAIKTSRNMKRVKSEREERWQSERALKYEQRGEPNKKTHTN